MDDELVKVSLARLLAQTGEGRRLRERARVSLREVAASIDIDPATLGRWERGQAVPRPDGAVRWVSCLQSLAAVGREVSP